MGNSPTTIFSGTTQAEDAKDRFNNTLSRIATITAVTVFFPLATGVFFLWILLFLYARMPWWVPAPFALLVWIITFQFDGGAFSAALLHLSLLGDIFGGISSDEGFWSWLSENWVVVIGKQLWFALLAGSTAAAVIAGWKWIRRPKWEERTIWVGPFLKKREEKTAKLIASGQDSPVDGITVGIAIDKRDPRFAGGKPGAPYGKRAILLDSEGAGHTLVVGGSGSGKALDVDTLIPLYSENIEDSLFGETVEFKRMGDIIVGDVLFDENLNPAKVVGAFDEMVNHRCFEVIFSDGSRIVADAEHLWRVKDLGFDGKNKNWVVLNSERIAMSELLCVSGVERFWLPAVKNSRRSDEANEIIKERSIVKIRPIVSRSVRCIAVDSPHNLFLAGENFVPTHNTTTMLMGMRDVIRRGNGLIVVDCKGGPDVPEQVAEWASRYGRKFYHWSMIDPREEYVGPADDGPAYYDPVGRGDPSRRKDLIIGSQRWDVEYYKTVIGDYLQTAFTVMSLVPPTEDVDTLRDIADLLSPQNLIRRASVIPKKDYPDLALALQRLANLGDQEKSGINNMYARLNTIMSSIAGAWLRKDPEGTKDIDLLKIAHEGDVVVFSLDTSNYEETSALLAGLIVQDLKTVSSSLREYPAATPVHVYIDEFAAVDATNISGLLAKARDAKMPVSLATQALADLRRREAHFDSQVIGIVGSFLIHRANGEEDARVYAGLSGLTMKRTTRMSLEYKTGAMNTMDAASSSGKGFSEEKEAYRIDPGVFQSLKQGQCVMIAKIPDERYIAPVRVVREDSAATILNGDGPLDPARKPWGGRKEHKGTFLSSNDEESVPVVLSAKQKKSKEVVVDMQNLDLPFDDVDFDVVGAVDSLEDSRDSVVGETSEPSFVVDDDVEVVFVEEAFIPDKPQVPQRPMRPSLSEEAKDVSGGKKAPDAPLPTIGSISELVTKDAKKKKTHPISE
jgi:hypothetical protein